MFNFRLIKLVSVAIIFNSYLITSQNQIVNTKDRFLNRKHYLEETKTTNIISLSIQYEAICNDKCKDCSNKCHLCIDGYAFKLDEKNQLQCMPNELPNCKLEDLVLENQEIKNICLNCIDGYVLRKNKCFLCSEAFPNCNYCSHNNICESCDLNYEKNIYLGTEKFKNKIKSLENLLIDDIYCIDCFEKYSSCKNCDLVNSSNSSDTCNNICSKGMVYDVDKDFCISELQQCADKLGTEIKYARVEDGTCKKYNKINLFLVLFICFGFVFFIGLLFYLKICISKITSRISITEAVPINNNNVYNNLTVQKLDVTHSLICSFCSQHCEKLKDTNTIVESEAKLKNEIHIKVNLDKLTLVELFCGGYVCSHCISDFKVNLLKGVYQNCIQCKKYVLGFKILMENELNRDNLNLYTGNRIISLNNENPIITDEVNLSNLNKIESTKSCFSLKTRDSNKIKTEYFNNSIKKRMINGTFSNFSLSYNFRQFFTISNDSKKVKSFKNPKKCRFEFDEICFICREVNPTSVIPCINKPQHKVHLTCLSLLLENGIKTCPICRTEINFV